MRVYIAGALSSKENTERNPSKIVCDYITNLSKMCQIASEVLKRGHSLYVPGLDFMLGVIAGDWTEKDYRGIGMSFLEVCDCVLIISDSWGVRKEVERAHDLGIRVYYRLEDLNGRIH